MENVEEKFKMLENKIETLEIDLLKHRFNFNVMLLITMFIALCGFSIFGYVFYFHPEKFSNKTYAVIDINKIISSQKTKLGMDTMAGKDVNLLAKDAENFGSKLESTIKVLQAECNCHLFVSDAVVSNDSMPDLTEKAIEKLGLKRE